MLSSRLPPDLAPNALTRALAILQARGIQPIDLTQSNPTRAGLPYPAGLLAPLGDPAGLVYEPRPLGLPAAREAVAHDFARRGLDVPPHRIVLTASTSEAYALLFKVLCGAGDSVLVPRPSYPLFEHLARLEAVTAHAYDLECHGTWRIDFESVGRALDARSRMVIVVSPNNPTGSFLHRDDLAALTSLCRRHRLSLVGDEVFADYPLDPAPDATPVLAQQDVLTFALGGLSKSAGLPQVKLGWVGVGGPATEVADALAALELACDTYLSVSTPVQRAAAALVAGGAVVREAIHARVRRNLAALKQAALAAPAVTALPVEGGWSAVLRVPNVRTEERLVLDLVEQDHVLVHPGYFFDFASEAFLVVSLLVEPDAFDRGVATVLQRAGAAA